MLKKRFSPGMLLARMLREKRPHARRRVRPVVSTEQLESRLLLSGAPVLVSFNHVPGTNADVYGQISNNDGNDTSLWQVAVEFDFDEDGSADFTTQTDYLGAFNADLGTLQDGNIQVRVGDADGWSDWIPQSLSLPAPPQIVAVDYEAGTLARISGSITNDNGLGFIPIDLDLNGDGFADNSTYTDSNGHFAIDFPATSGQEMTVRLRATDMDGSSDWVDFTFTPYNEPPEITSLSLVDDADGDSVTTNGTITGSISNDGSVAGVMIEIDIDGDGFADVMTSTDSDGNFTIDLTPYLMSGPVTISVRPIEWVDMQPVYGEWTSISFTLEEENEGPSGPGGGGEVWL